MDKTPFLHAAIAIAAQVLIGLLCGNWWVGGALACVWWSAREHTQAEYRWIQRHGSGIRACMPWWGGFDPRVWDAASVLDFVVPIIACVCVYFAALAFVV